MDRGDSTRAPASGQNKWLIICTIMMVAILEVLDSTIVNVALPNMMPSLGADQSEITWVLTSYVVAAAMMLPLTGFLSDRLGTKKLLLIDIIGFMISSFACGAANSLTMMVIVRLLQGGFGAALIPLSQAILRASFPLSEQPKAMAIWGLGIMAAPVFGPTLGGFIVAHFSWRWIFYLNAPICFVGLLMTLAFIPDFPAKKRKIDFWGVFFMFLAIGCLQIFLDQGNEKGWFHSNTILLLCVTSLFSLIVFLTRSFKNPRAVITLAIFNNRNFSLCTLLLAAYCGCLFSFITLEPIMLEHLFGYTPMIAGETMISLGLASALGMGIGPPLMQKINVKYILIVSCIASAIGAYYFSTFSLLASQVNFFIGNAFFGFGLGCFMVPLTTYSLATLPPKYITEGAGLFTYGRMLGTSIGISLISTFVSREAQINWQALSISINKENPNLTAWLAQQHLNLQNANALIKLQTTLATQSSLLSFIDAFRLIAIILVLITPVILWMKNVKLTKAIETAH